MIPVDALLAPEGARSMPVRGLVGDQAHERLDWVAEEVPIALEFNGVAHAVMLATPLDLTDFALGFALTEGLLEHPGELLECEESQGADGVTLHLRISARSFARLKDRRRSLAGRTGCGLCGAESLAHVNRPLAVLPQGPAIPRSAIARGMSELRARQVLHRATGAAHAAAWCDARGDVRVLREDIGRHNALDKLVGALVRDGLQAASGFVAVTSRASFEMVQKTASAGVALLAAVSAPTTLAVQTADHLGLTLAGFARGGDLVVYAHPERLWLERTDPCTLIS